MAANPHLLDWLAREPCLDGLSALDVGCGLGDNAAALAGAGATVTAFDLVPRAAEWAAARFPDIGAVFCAGDLFAPPSDWLGAFDLVHETYTLQALPAEILPAARKALADLVRPGGRLLVIARARDEGQGTDGPPWPLARSDLDAFAGNGLVLERLDDLPPGVTANRHWRAVLSKPV
jgi:SAM-dependent methyltransferase